MLGGHRVRWQAGYGRVERGLSRSTAGRPPNVDTIDGWQLRANGLSSAATAEACRFGGELDELGDVGIGFQLRVEEAQLLRDLA